MAKNPKTRVFKMVTQVEAARILGMSPRTLETWRYNGTGPAYSSIHGRIRYDVRDLEAYAEARRVETDGT